jgi:hypothetical protein
MTNPASADCSAAAVSARLEKFATRVWFSGEPASAATVTARSSMRQLAVPAEAEPVPPYP